MVCYVLGYINMLFSGIIMGSNAKSTGHFRDTQWGQTTLCYKLVKSVSTFMLLTRDGRFQEI